jgi:hypothetical protein
MEQLPGWRKYWKRRSSFQCKLEAWEGKMAKQPAYI